MSVEDSIKQAIDLLKDMKDETKKENDRVLELSTEIETGDFEHYRDTKNHKRYTQ
jgi:hypothetical protein